MEPCRQPFASIHSAGGLPPVAGVLVDSSVVLGVVVANHSSADSAPVPVPAKYPPGTLICEPLPLKLAAVPSGKPVGPGTPSVTFAYVAGGRGLAEVAAPPTMSWASGPEVSLSGQKSSGDDPSTALS
jgi:hypothetical protein